MKYGIYTPNFGPCGNPKTLIQLAEETESAGWDGFFESDARSDPRTGLHFGHDRDVTRTQRRREDSALRKPR